MDLQTTICVGRMTDAQRKVPTDTCTDLHEISNLFLGPKDLFWKCERLIY